MIETQATEEKVSFDEIADAIEEIKLSSTEVVNQMPIDSAMKTTILISVEENIKKLVSALANKETIGWNTNCDVETYSHLPNSITGVIVYYLIKGIKEELGLEFEKQPKCLTYNTSTLEKKKAGKKRLITKEQKNELLSKTQINFYDTQISNGEMSIEDAMEEIKNAYNQIKAFEEMGYILPPQKHLAPYWLKKETNSTGSV